MITGKDLSDAGMPDIHTNKHDRYLKKTNLLFA